MRSQMELVAADFVPYVSIYAVYIFFPHSILLLIVYLSVRAEIFSLANNLFLLKKEIVAIAFFLGHPEQARSHKVVTNRKLGIRKATSLGTSFTNLCALGFIRNKGLMKRSVTSNGVLKRRPRPDTSVELSRVL